MKNLVVELIILLRFSRFDSLFGKYFWLLCVFVCLFVWGFLVPLENFSLIWRPLPVKGCKFWPMLGTHGHWAVRVLSRATPTVTQGIRLLRSSTRTRDILANCRAFDRGVVSTCFFDLGLSRLGFELPM